MITGFSFDTEKEEWLADYQTKNKGLFKPLYQNCLGYHIKVGRKNIYLTDEQIKQFENTRKGLKEEGYIQ
jgi:hypothetical protein